LRESLRKRRRKEMIKILQGNCLDKLKELPDQSINTCITSPPYWGLRDYGEDKQLGMEDTPEEFVNNLVEVFREVKRVLRDDGTVWLNLGDSYSSGGRTTTTNQSLRGDKDYGVTRPKPSKGIKPKDLIGIPWRVAFALQQDGGWYLRQDIIWHKPNPMPESVRDRCTKAHEYIFLLSKSPKYYFDSEAIKEDAVQGKKNKRSVWTVTTKPFKGAHFATFPMDLIEPCVLAGCPENGTVLDPFGGSGTTGIVASNHNRKSVLIELNTEYIEIAKQRIQDQGGLFTDLEILGG
jgi:site-specific DNA-methyltransferase (adenine-specific)